MSGPLEGIRVLDLSAMLSGPWAADLLGDQGAEVIKVEPPKVGDHVRSLPNRQGGLASMFINVNRSKRSITVNLKSPEGIKVLHKLVESADVLVQNFRPGVVERLGISWEDLRKVNPELVYLSISGFGEVGPYASKRVYDPIVQALSGLASIQAGSDDARPRLIRTVLPDKLTAMLGAQAVCAALLSRVRTGEGQHIQLSMLDSVMSFLWVSDMNAYTFVDAPVAPEKAASFIDLIYETSDGYITVSTMSNAEWEAFCRASGRLELLKDERFSTPSLRDANVNARLEEIQKSLKTKTSAEWLQILNDHDVPCAPALRRFELIEHPQVIASESLVETTHPTAGRLRQARTAARFSGTPVDKPRGAPRLGEHSVEVLESLGFDTQEIAQLIADGVVGEESAAPPVTEDQAVVVTQGA